MDDIYQNQLEILTRKYIQSLQDKHQQILTLLTQLDASQWSDAAQVADLYKQIHKLSGSAGSYGFDDLSESAMQVDQILKNRIPNIKDDREISRKITALLDDIKTIYENSSPSSQ